MDLSNVSLLSTLVLIFSSAIAGGFIAHWLKVPLVLGYIGVGVLIGNLVPSLFDVELMHLIGDVGVTLLLFTLGVELSFHRLRHVLGTVFWAAFLQIMLVTLFLFVLLYAFFGLSFVPSLFVAIAGALSSTAIVIKILFERGELDSMPGDVLTGWLVIQDISVIPIMILLPVIVSTYVSGNATVGGMVTTIAFQLTKAVVAIGLVLFLGKRGVPFALNRVSRLGSREVFLVTTVSIVFLAAVAAYAFGLSAGLGAFIAGLLIAETGQNHMVFAEVRPLRDVFSTVFFVTLGMSISIGAFLYIWPLAFALVLLILLSKFCVVFFLSRFLGYHPKTSWLVSLGLLPMSEFGFLLAREGVTMGALSTQDFTLIITLVVASIAVGSPLLFHGQGLYYRLKHSRMSWFLRTGKRQVCHAEQPSELPFQNHVVICGFGRMGRYVGRALEMAEIPFVVVDYNHTTVAKARGKGIPVVYGDPADRDVLDKAQVDYARALVIAIPDRHSQELIIGHALTLNKSIRIICRTHHEEDQSKLKSLGVHSIVQPEFEAALTAVRRLTGEYGISPEDFSGKLSRLKLEHGIV